MLIPILILIFSFTLLIKSADILVDGAASLAKKLKIPPIAIGLTIIAFGTSAPELIVNIFSSLSGANEIALGNILGSNIANILLILGIAATLKTLRVQQSTTWKEIPFSLLAIIVLGVLVNDTLLAGTTSILSRADGIILMAFFIIFLYYTYGIAKNSKLETSEVKTYSNILSSLMIVGGLIGLTIGGKFVVDSAVSLATLLGVSQAFIGLTIVALGTSLPELVVSAVAAYKNHADIAVGNIVGSNIFNIFWILGLSAIISPITFNTNMNLDLLITMIVTILLIIFIFIGERHTLNRWHGISFILLYVAYITLLIIRG
ncbi:sodium:proton exchanger [Candidatus Falkowbacteria bacterium RIFOXYD2_FULL_35_9]|uniref:Sodium:proton exchanger n=1 Tax=Candidatus Falkowbacteria bacterium RIFOXYC2_FULL_36_12 TaxID=1798002 RepID=A0A1F5SVW1_9BACT|nr:MAG: sodium:proton exchanger [Candidatus Falkowbacteria bacterium RIFOXYB2_FULL_35_7]OGF30864.1 MAG: sodium:proton exchanger [Candidatus Falkowbacteria bacterium RIFOXYC2_FULL_36_12]OGF34243.1 MAG: sodium:proton exchanger [Candidatus Falkowbacteria bacterium RIFOXYA2_FULL_35_8]OGF48222.1 MAG: sodium:proton exchanger [Candidatus Falkowbacteria bacterium RIFOXYD2_FULL_35_9]